MRIISGRVPRAKALAGVGVELSRAAHQRLKGITHYQTRGRNAALTCRYFGISRQTFYRWKRRYDPHQLSSLEDRSHRPHRRRQPTWTPQLAEQVLRLRQQYPRWGKDKLRVLLRRDGWQVSTSMVGASSPT
ncbi:MAG: helix-turn-helix domain-containing protein [Chloroflexota bacterium]|mgnify:CR=1 FL=1